MTAPVDRRVVLVVDDERLNLTTFNRVFRRDVTVRTAGTAREALAALAAETVDVLIVDFSMPDMLGVELLRRARAVCPGVPAILLTAHADLAEVRAAVAEGLAAAAIMKPWERAEILGWIERLCGGAAR